MRRFVTVLTAAVAVAAFSTMGFAQASAPAKPAATAKPAVAAKAPVAKPAARTTRMSVKGEFKYDEATKTLTVGEKSFTLAPDVKIMMGAKTMIPADINGKHGMVTYTVVDGKDVASKVTIAATRPAPKAKETAKK